MEPTSGLTNAHLKALRNATTLVIRSHYPGSPYADGKDLPASWIEAVKEVDPGDGFGRRDLRIEIPTEVGGVSNYTKGFGPVLYASWVFLFTGWDTPVGTLIRGVLRAGDRIRPLFVAGNDNENVRSAGLTIDEIHLIVERGPVDQPSKCKRLNFELDTCVYPPHSMGRNIHFGSPTSEILETK